MLKVVFASSFALHPVPWWELSCTWTGAVKLYNEANTLLNPKIVTPAEKCRMMIRLRRAGVGFTVVPQRRQSGGLAVSTTATFLDPQFVSVHAYGCDHPDTMERKFQVNSLILKYFKSKQHTYSGFTFTCNN